MLVKCAISCFASILVLQRLWDRGAGGGLQDVVVLGVLTAHPWAHCSPNKYPIVFSVRVFLVCFLSDCVRFPFGLTAENKTETTPIPHCVY